MPVNSWASQHADRAEAFIGKIKPDLTYSFLVQARNDQGLLIVRREQRNRQSFTGYGPFSKMVDHKLRPRNPQEMAKDGRRRIHFRKPHPRPSRLPFLSRFLHLRAAALRKLSHFQRETWQLPCHTAIAAASGPHAATREARQRTANSPAPQHATPTTVRRTARAEPHATPAPGESGREPTGRRTTSRQSVPE